MLRHKCMICVFSCMSLHSLLHMFMTFFVLSWLYYFDVCVCVCVGFAPLFQVLPRFKVVGGAIPVVMEDDHIAVVFKPAGLATNGARLRTLENALHQDNVLLRPSASSGAAGAGGGETHADANVLPVARAAHRLDAQTGGLVVLAKTKTALAGLNRAFSRRAVVKRYRAILAGQLGSLLEGEEERGEEGGGKMGGVRMKDGTGGNEEKRRRIDVATDGSGSGGDSGGGSGEGTDDAMGGVKVGAKVGAKGVGGDVGGGSTGGGDVVWTKEEGNSGRYSCEVRSQVGGKEAHSTFVIVGH